MSITARRLMLAVVLIALAFGVYLVDLERRTVLGERALRATQLEFLDFDTALARSRSTGRPVLAEFSAIWCPACRRLHEQVLSDPEVRAELRAHFVLARIDYESPGAAAFMQRYLVKGFPTLLLIDQDGRLERRLPVPEDAAGLLVNLRFQPLGATPR